MKNLLPLLFIACLFYSSCEKESLALHSSEPIKYTCTISKESPFTHQTVPIGSSANYYLLEDRLLLENSHDFSLLLWSLQEDQHYEWEKEIGFDSYSKIYEQKAGLETDIIKRVLNKDGIIQINPWIFKLDFKARKVYVLSIEDKEHIDDLISMNYANLNILSFSFEDDVWYLLENGLTSPNTTNNKRCQELKAKNKYISATTASCICTPIYWQNSTIAIRYNKFGIWETVKAFYFNNYYDVYGQNSNHLTPANLHKGTIHYHFDERCGTTYYGTMILPAGQFSHQTYLLRSDKKPLERNKSIINMTVETSYIIYPPEAVQTINTILKNF